MTRHRDFTAASAPPGTLSFTVAGKRQSDESAWEEKFQCWPRIAPQALADLAMAMRVDDQGNRIWNASACISFVRRALYATDDKMRWAELCNDPDRALDLQTDLGPILLWLAEEYTDRPTPPPST